MTAIGVRQLRNGLSRYLRRVREGESVMVTDRGEPLAIISPAGTTRSDRRIEAMLREGLAKWAGGKPRGVRRPPRVRGASVAQAVIEDRR